MENPNAQWQEVERILDQLERAAYQAAQAPESDSPGDVRNLAAQVRGVWSVLQPVDARICEELHFIRSQEAQLRERYDHVQHRLHQTREELQDAEETNIALRADLERVGKDLDLTLKSQGVLQRDFRAVGTEARKVARDQALQRPALEAMSFQAVEEAEGEEANGSTIRDVQPVGGTEKDMSSLCDQPRAPEISEAAAIPSSSCVASEEALPEADALASAQLSMTGTTWSTQLSTTASGTADNGVFGPSRYKNPMATLENCYKSARPPPQVSSAQPALQNSAWPSPQQVGPPVAAGVWRRTSVKSPPRSLSASAATPSMLSRVPSAPATLTPVPVAMTSVGSLTVVAGPSAISSGVNHAGSALSPSAQVRQARSPALVRKARSPRSVSPVMTTVRVGQEAPPRGLSPVTVIAREGTVSPLPLPLPPASTPAAQVRARSPRGLNQRVSPGPPQCLSPSQQQRRSPRVQAPRVEGSRLVPQRSLPSYAWSPRNGSLSQSSSIAVPVQNGAVNAVSAVAGSAGLGTNAHVLSAVNISTAAAQGMAMSSAVGPAGGSVATTVAKGTANGPVAPSTAGMPAAGAAGMSDQRWAAWSGTRSPRPSPKATPRPASTTNAVISASAARPAPMQPPRAERSPRQLRGSAPSASGLSGNGAVGLRRVSPSTRPMVRPPAGGGSHSMPME